MRLLSIHVFSLYQSKPILLSSAFSLSFVSNFHRGALKDYLTFYSRLVIERVAQGFFVNLELEKGICYAMANSDKIGVTIICDEEYPKSSVFEFLLKIYDNFKTFVAEKKLDLYLYTADTDVKYEYIANEIEDWQDPSKKDNLMKLKKKINEYTEIMRQKINESLKKEETLEELMKKADELCAKSKEFYEQAIKKK